MRRTLRLNLSEENILLLDKLSKEQNVSLSIALDTLLDKLNKCTSQLPQLGENNEPNTQ